MRLEAGHFIHYTKRDFVVVVDQIRVNSGDVVSRDGRGVAAQHVLAVLERDPMHYARDDKPLRLVGSRSSSRRWWRLWIQHTWRKEESIPTLNGIFRKIYPLKFL